MAMEMFKDPGEGVRIDLQGFEPMDLRDYQRKRVVDDVTIPQVEFKWRRLCTLDIRAGLVEVRKVEPGPQRGTG
jgi:hypothetical protein